MMQVNFGITVYRENLGKRQGNTALGDRGYGCSLVDAWLETLDYMDVQRRYQVKSESFFDTVCDVYLPLF